MKANKKRFVSIFLVALLAMSWMICVDAMAQKKPMILRMVTAIPANAPPMSEMLDNMAKKFNERAKGEYKIEVYYGGALAKVPEYYDAIMFGTVEIGVVAPAIFGNLDPRLGGFEIPFLINSWEANIAAAPRILPLYDQILQEKFNAKGLTIWCEGGFHFLSTKKPLKKLEDFKGLMLGAVSPTAASLVKDLGGSPVTIMWNELYESLQKGVIDGTTQQPRGSLLTNTIDVCKYFTYSYIFPSFLGMSMNLDAWKKMPPNIQEILLEEANAGAEWMNKTKFKNEADDLKAIEKRGAEIYYLPKSERDRWVEATKATTEKKLSALGSFGTEFKKITDELDQKFPYTH